MTSICGFMCEAIKSNYQLFNVNCNDIHYLNKFSFLTIANCGMTNRGNSACGVSGESHFTIENINSSYNFNHINDKSFGACFRTMNVKGYRVSYYSFYQSEGHDIINTNFFGQPNVEYNGTFVFGNVYNCSSDYICKYRGINYIQNNYFGSLTHKKRSFGCGASNYAKHLLRITNCHFDSIPTDITTSCEITYSYEDNPFKTEVISHLGIDMCPVPSDHFTESQQFTISFVFTASKIFSSSIFFTFSSKFTSSEKFSRSNSFSDSSEFTSSEKFSPTPSIEFTSSFNFTESMINNESTLTFTASDPFTPSFTFSPNRTKYPDGLADLNHAKVSGQSKLDVPASSAAIGATAGLSFVIIGVSVFLMIIYLRSKQKELKGRVQDFSDSFLVDTTDQNDSSYSYSYYTYDYTYVSNNDEEEESSYDSYYYSYYSCNAPFIGSMLELAEKEDSSSSYE